MENQEDKIIVTASRLFEQYGIRSVSIENVCKELHISKKTFYTFFAQKEDLVDVVFQHHKKNQFEKFAKNLKDKNAIESLIFIIKEIKKSQDCESQNLVYDFEKYYPELYEKHEKLKNENIRLGFEHNLKQGINEGYYRNDLDIELVSLFHTVQMKATFQMMHDSTNKYPKKRIMDFFLDLIVHLIANEKGLKYMDEHYNKTEV